MKHLLLAILVSLATACATPATTPSIKEPITPAIMPIAIKPQATLTQVLANGTHSFRGTDTMVSYKVAEQGKDAMYLDRPRGIMVIVKTGIIDDPLEVFSAKLMIAIANSGFGLGNPEAIVWLNHQATYFTIERTGLRAYQWIGLVDGQGVAFTCGGKLEDAHRNDVLCHDMADSFILAPLPSTGQGTTSN
jgi:hypothetical protein